MGDVTDPTGALVQEFGDGTPERELVEAAEAFLEIAMPAGAKYEVGLRFQFWQARDRLKAALAAAKEASRV